MKFDTVHMNYVLKIFDAMAIRIIDFPDVSGSCHYLENVRRRAFMSEFLIPSYCFCVDSNKCGCRKNKGFSGLFRNFPEIMDSDVVSKTVDLRAYLIIFLPPFHFFVCFNGHDGWRLRT